MSAAPARPRREPVRFAGTRAAALDTARNRLLVAGVAFVLAFLLVAGRLVELGLLADGGGERLARAGAPAPTAVRGDVVDRNGVLLATSLPTASLYADPAEILDARAAAARVSAVLPDLDAQALASKLAGPGRFVWVRRNLTPSEHYAVHRLGIPGLRFVREERRVYPHGRAAAHVLGLADRDGRGIAGVERAFDAALARGERLRLALDIRVQDILGRELATAMQAFDAVGAAGVVMDVRTGEVLAMVSLPGFDPNAPTEAPEDNRFNRATKGVYELGSVFKLFTAAMALDTGTIGLQDGYDASEPLRVARFTIRDFHPENRWLSVPEILVHSSNIGAAKMALDVGGAAQRRYLGRLGLLAPAAIELPEVGSPLVPRRWRDINTMTVAYGHGIAVAPVNLAAAVSALVNGGVMRPPTVLAVDGEPAAGERVLATDTSRTMRRLMRLVVQRGTGSNADAPGYRVGGKTGTAEKLDGGRYRDGARISSFVGAFPIDEPRYVVLAMLDEPEGRPETLGYATGGWVAAPVVGRTVTQIGPLLGLAPAVEEPRPIRVRAPAPKPRLAAARAEPALFETIGRAIADARAATRATR